MKNFDLEREAKKLFTSNIINTISLIHEYKGKQALYIETKKDSLTNLLSIAKIQSAEYSNKIEGIKTTDARIKDLINDKVAPKNRNEEEIAGYRDVLELIHENYDNVKQFMTHFVQTKCVINLLYPIAKRELPTYKGKVLFTF